MDKRLPTATRILAASRRLFNKKGYAATSLTEIAEDVGISQGNLSYHFPTKKDLVNRLREDARKGAQARLAALTPGVIADDYVEHLLFAMTLIWENRFVFRDRHQYTDVKDSAGTDAAMQADFDELHGLLRRIETENLLRRDVPVDLEILTRTLWVVSRYWMDYLLEFEGREEVTWADQERGIQHHFAVLFPYLVASARKEFQDALVRMSCEKQAPGL